MKSEPGVFGIDDLARSPGRTTAWDGVRNYQVRNMMRDRMLPGDQALFYHSNCAEPGVTGIADIVTPAYPDATAFDPADSHYDPGSNPDEPRWYVVDVRLRRKFKRNITLAELRQEKSLADMVLLQRGNRLSIMPVTRKQWDTIAVLERAGRGVQRKNIR